MEFLKKFLNRIRLYLQVTHMGSIARRYFIMNGFDGSMTMLGLIGGAWISRVNEPKVILGLGFGGSLAMGMSGFFGAYMAEKAERKGHLKILEESMLADLNESVHGGAAKFVSVYAALIDGISPALTGIISLIPFFLTMGGMFSIWNAYVISLVLTLATLFSLGIYLGKIAKENIWLYGAQTIIAGIITAAIIFILGLI